MLNTSSGSNYCKGLVCARRFEHTVCAVGCVPIDGASIYRKEATLVEVTEQGPVAVTMAIIAPTPEANSIAALLGLMKLSVAVGMRRRYVAPSTRYEPIQNAH
jgi:hypothetical protein